jgi:hypothetical protein
MSLKSKFVSGEIARKGDAEGATAPETLRQKDRYVQALTRYTL